VAFVGLNSISRPDSKSPAAWYPYTCAYCGTKITGAVVALAGELNPTAVSINDSTLVTRWLVCTGCGGPSVATSSGQVYPSVPFGPVLEALPEEVNAAYDEARTCFSVSAFTACELICRKILMHIAVDKGAKEGDTFEHYITHLEILGYVTPPMKGWVKLIKDHGNKSTHRLAAPDKVRAQGTLMFTVELLRLTYEMEYTAQQYAPSPPATSTL